MAKKKKFCIIGYRKAMDRLKAKKQEEIQGDISRKQSQLASQKYKQAFKNWLAGRDYSLPKPKLEDFM